MTGNVDPEAARWAREQAKKRFESIMQLLQQTGVPIERERLKQELARLARQRATPFPGMILMAGYASGRITRRRGRSGENPS